MNNSADVLLKLLEKVPDSKKLDMLLESRNLLTLLQRYGRDKDEIRQALKQGKKPGDLLLELLEEEPNADKLLAELGKQGRVAASPVPASPHQNVVLADVRVDGMSSTDDSVFAAFKSASKTKNDDVVSVLPDTGNNLFGAHAGTAAFLIAGFAVVLPAMAMTNFLPIGKPTPLVATLIAVLGGAFAGAVSEWQTLFSPKGTLVGIVFGFGALWATIKYLELRDTIFHIELLLPILIGSLPALLVYILLYGKLPKLE